MSNQIAVGQTYRSKLTPELAVVVCRGGYDEIKVSPLNENGDPTAMRVDYDQMQFLSRYELVA